MDPLVQRLQIAQELVTNLCHLLSLPSRPDRATVQSYLDAANAQLKVLDAQAPPAFRWDPLAVPQLVPAAPASPAAA